MNDFVDVVIEVLNLKGLSVLESPRLFVACLADVSGAQWQRENALMKRNCDQRFLACFIGDKIVDSGTALYARASAAAMLRDDYGLSGENADRLSWVVVDAVCTFKSIDFDGASGKRDEPNKEQPNPAREEKSVRRESSHVRIVESSKRDKSKEERPRLAREDKPIRQDLRGALRAEALDGLLGEVSRDVSCDIGDCYYFGIGVESDAQQAAACYEWSAKKGSPRGKRNIGYCYLEGKGVEVDFKSAAIWLQQAVKADYFDAAARYALGYCRFKGLGLKRDRRAASVDFSLAAEWGNEQAAAVMRGEEPEEPVMPASPVRKKTRQELSELKSIIRKIDQERRGNSLN